MGLTYGIIRETHEVSGNTRESYGIAAYFNTETDGSACVLYAARDLSRERAPLEALVERLNRECASELHFEELIEDFLSDESMQLRQP